MNDTDARRQPDDDAPAGTDPDAELDLFDAAAAENADDDAGLTGAAAQALELAVACIRQLPGPDFGEAQLIEWIEAIVDRDERALTALYDATMSRVYGIVMRVVRRASLAEEVVEETYFQVWRQAARFDVARGRPLTWLLAMARSRAIDALRREQRFVHDELPPDDALVEHSHTAPPPQDLLHATRGAEHLQAALLALTARERQLVSLAFFRGLTHEEIAEQQDMPLGSVKSLIRRALLQLRQRLEANHG